MQNIKEFCCVSIVKKGYLLLPKFWPIFLLSFWKKSKNSEKQRKSKKYVFNIFAPFLAFSTSSKKEFKFSKVFETRSTFHASFLKSLIFLIESTLVLLVFKKYKKLRKIKIYKNKIKLRDQFWGSSNILPINSCLQHPSRGGAILKEKYKKKEET
jgi:hypothetical protein